MTGDFVEAVNLAAAGLTYVFIFLGVLILLLMTSSWVFSFFNKEAAEEDELQLAAVTAAVQHHKISKK